MMEFRAAKGYSNLLGLLYNAVKISPNSKLTLNTSEDNLFGSCIKEKQQQQQQTVSLGLAAVPLVPEEPSRVIIIPSLQGTQTGQ